MKKLSVLAVVLVVMMLFVTACGAPVPTEATETDLPETAAPEAEPETAEPEAAEPEAAEPEAEPEEVAAGHSSAVDFVYNTEAGAPIDVAQFFDTYGLEVESTITSTGGDVTVDKAPSVMPTPNEDYVIGLAIHNTSDIVGKTIFEQMQKACDELGLQYELNDAAADQNIQNAAIEQWVATDKVDGVVVYPRNYSAVGPALDELAAAGIPTVVGITPIQGTADALTLIPNEEMGAASAEYIIDGLEAAGKELKGTVVYGTLNIIHSNVPGREYGFFQVMDQYPDLEVVKIEGAAVEDFYDQMESMLTADSQNEIVAAWGLYSGAMLGMSQAIQSNDRADITMVGIDYDQKVMADIKEGVITATMGHSPVLCGYWNVCNLVNLLNGQTVPAITRVPYDVITQDNVDAMYEMYFPGAGTLDEYIQSAGEEAA